jgi:hypothetical protein
MKIHGILGIDLAAHTFTSGIWPSSLARLCLVFTMARSSPPRGAPLGHGRARNVLVLVHIRRAVMRANTHTCVRARARARARKQTVREPGGERDAALNDAATPAARGTPGESRRRDRVPVTDSRSSIAVSPWQRK